MKKSILFFAFMIAFVVAAQAQGPTFGLRAGVNYAGISGDEAGDLDRVFGFHAGVLAKFYMSYDSFFVIQPEVLFSRKGAENENDDLKIQLSYIDIPVLGRVNAGFLYFEGGPQLSVRIGGNIRGDQNDLVDSDDLHFFRRTGFGYVAGVGLAATPLGLSVGLRYNGEISTLNNTDNIPNIRNNWFMLTLSYAIQRK